MKKNILLLSLLTVFSMSASATVINQNASVLEMKKSQEKKTEETTYNLKAYKVNSKEESDPKFKITKSNDVIVSEKYKELANTILETNKNKDFEVVYNSVEYVKSMNDKLEKETGLVEESFKVKLVKLDTSNYKVFISQNVINGLDHFTSQDLKIDLPIQSQFDFSTDLKIDSGETIVIDSPSYESDDGYFQNKYIITIH